MATIEDVNSKKRSIEEHDSGESSENNNKLGVSAEQAGDDFQPITADGEMPQKKFYRQRAHCNPLSHNDSFVYPVTLDDTKWLDDLFPDLPKDKRCPTVLDCGCGFGGLTVALASLLPEEVVLGLEIRAKVTEYVRLRIVALRKDNPGRYQNCSVLRTNSMKFLPNFFPKESLKKMFFCFPDPHFKRKNHGRRIISERLLDEYAYLLKPGIGRLYCITDVKELHEWHIQKCNAHPLFRRVPEEAVKVDPCVEAMFKETEEAKKVERLGGDNSKGEKYYAVYERIPNSEMPRVTAGDFFPEVVEEADNEDEREKE